MTKEVSRKTHLTKSWKDKAIKSGPHHSIYWVKSNKKDILKPSLLPKSYSTSIKYTGDWKNDKKNGFGSQTWSNGDKYDGNWVANRRNGQGIFWINRQGKLIKQYSGEWKDDGRSGTGTFYYSDGAKYCGDWLKNKRHGVGEMVYADGSVYNGGWLNGLRSGKGILTCENGNRYEGYWLYDKKEGPGKYFYFKTKKVYHGEWHNDIAKCGQFHHIHNTESSQTIDNFILPYNELKYPENVILDAINRVRSERTIIFSESSANSDGQKLNNEDRGLLENAFRNHEIDKKGFIRCANLIKILNEAFPNEIFPEEKVSILLEELNATYDTHINLEELVELVELLL